MLTMAARSRKRNQALEPSFNRNERARSLHIKPHPGIQERLHHVNQQIDQNINQGHD